MKVDQAHTHGLAKDKETNDSSPSNRASVVKRSNNSPLTSKGTSTKPKTTQTCWLDASCQQVAASLLTSSNCGKSDMFPLDICRLVASC